MAANRDLPASSFPAALGCYELLKEQDGGGMATVYLARRTGPGGFCRLLAIKRIRPDLAGDPAMVAAFLAEARVSALLRHPNLIAVHDLIEEGGAPSLVMEFVHGRVLSTVAQRGSELGRPLPLPLSVMIIVKALQGLAHAHEATDLEGRPLGLIHRDISPQNILLGFDGEVRLFDFGIAETASSGGRASTGVLSGKFAYLSPEGAQGQTVDPRSDLFGIGVILHELLTQARLFKRSGQLLTLQAVTDDPIPEPRTLNPEVPEALSAIVMKALARDPGQRYPTARELAGALQGWLLGSGQPWGKTFLAAYLAELLGDELRQEQEEQRRLLGLPPAAAPEPAPAPGEAATLREGAPASGEGSAARPLAVASGEPVGLAGGGGVVAAPAVPASSMAPAAVSGRPAAAPPRLVGVPTDPGALPAAPPPRSHLGSLLLGAGGALLLVLAAALIVVVVQQGG